MNYRVVFFQTPRGDQVVADYVIKLDPATKSKYLRLIDLLQTYGPHLTMPYSKRLTPNLFELRTRGKKPIRVIYTQINHSYILLHVFQKQTNKTPQKEISTAESRRLTLI